MPRYGAKVQDVEFIRINVMLSQVRKLLEQGVQHRMHCPPALFGEEGPLPSSICTEVAPEHPFICDVGVGWAELAELVGRVVAKEDPFGEVVQAAFETPHHEEALACYSFPCPIFAWREHTIVCSFQRL